MACFSHFETAPFHGIRQRPTLPGDIAPLFRPQGAGADILTKYIL